MRRRVSSRLNRTSEKQNKRQALLFGGGLILLLVILINLGPLAINAIGGLISTVRGDEDQTAQIIGDSVLQPPILNTIPTATSSSTISFTGVSTTKDSTIEIYVNNDLEDEIRVRDDLEFEANRISLTKGANIIKARTSKDGQTSPFSIEYDIFYTDEKPKLELQNPSDGSSFSRADRTIQVRGITDPDSTVTINGFRAIVDASGNFSYNLALSDGDNNIIVKATNQAGVSTETSLKVTYSP